MGVWPHYSNRSFNVSDGGGRGETKPTASVSDWLSGRKSAYSCFLFDECRLAGWNTLFNSWEPRAHCQKDTIGISCVVSEKIFFPFSCKVKIKKSVTLCAATTATTIIFPLFLPSPSRDAIAVCELCREMNCCFSKCSRGGSNSKSNNKFINYAESWGESACCASAKVQGNKLKMLVLGETVWRVNIFRVLARARAKVMHFFFGAG